MYIEQLYTNCLAEAAYYIESDGEAAIVDPIRETKPYILMAASRGSRIKYVLETHIHADFVSGHLDLANETGAEIVFGPGAETGYTIHEARDGEILHLGKITIEVLHTPGHTPESICYLLRDESGKPHAIFTGDTLFVGDVGRPDLLDGKVTKEALAAMMYDSLRSKIAPLPDDVIVYPAHGPGSACGKNIGRETWSSLGIQKKSNYALQDMTRDEFVAKLTAGLAAPPQYYFKDAAINKRGYDSLSEVMSRNLHGLTLEDFISRVDGALILDARSPNDFGMGYIPNSINIGLDDKYAWWAGTLISISTPLLIVAPIGREEEAVRRLARIGYESVLGYLEGGFETYAKSGKPIDTVSSIDPAEFAEMVTSGSHGSAQILDVRNPGEYANAHIEDAMFIPLGSLEERIGELDSSQEEEYLIHCGGGYRSMIAASILRRHGFENVVNVSGGFSKIKHLIPELIVSEEAVDA